MYIEIYFRNDPTVYEGDQIKSLSYAPEIDQTMQSLPIEEFDCVIRDDVHTYTAFISREISIKVSWGSSTQTIVDSFTIYDVKKISSGIYQLKARNNTMYALSVFDAPLIDVITSTWVTPDLIISGIFNAAEQSGNYSISQLAYDVFNNSGTDKYFRGFVPYQNARERLRQVCQAYGLVVLQGSYKITITAATDNQHINRYDPDMTLCYPHKGNTYKDVKRSQVQQPRKVIFTFYDDWTKTDPQDSDYTKIQIGETEDLDPLPIYAWVRKREYTINPGGSGEAVTISDNVFMLWGSRTIMSDMAKTWGRRYEFDCEIANLPITNAPTNSISWLPSINNAISLISDDNLIYFGLPKRFEYTFGTTARVRITALTNLQSIGEMVAYKLRGVYKKGTDERILFEKEVLLSDGSNYGYTSKQVRNPVIECYVAGRLERFTPQSATTYIQYRSADTAADRIKTAYYTRADDPL